MFYLTSRAKLLPIILLLGSRQVGKTSIMLLLKKAMEKQNIPEKFVPYFTLQDPAVLNICFEGAENFI